MYVYICMKMGGEAAGRLIEIYCRVRGRMMEMSGAQGSQGSQEDKYLNVDGI